MKLLVVCQYFHPEPFRVGDVCVKLVSLGHEVTVLTGLPNYPMGEIYKGYDSAVEENWQGVRVLRCNLRPRLKGKKNLALNYLSFWREGNKLAKRLAGLNLELPKAGGPSGLKQNGCRFDQILVFQYSPVTMAIPALAYAKEIQKKTGHNIPVSLYCFDLWPESIVSAGLPNKGPIYEAVSILSKHIYKQVDQIFVSSPGFENYLRDKHGLTCPINHLPIYAEEMFSKSPDILNNLRDQNEDTINLLFAGNIGEMQSVDTILKAAAIIEMEKNNLRTTCKTGTDMRLDGSDEATDIRFHIVGDGSALEKCKALANELNLSNVTFHGRHPVEAMPEFYANAAAFLVTLKADPVISATLPGKVQSYMATGKPIIAAINGETARVMEESGCGLCAPAEDAEALATNILTFARQTKKERQEYGVLAKEYYEKNFSEKAFFSQLLELL